VTAYRLPAGANTEQRQQCAASPTPTCRRHPQRRRSRRWRLGSGAGRKVAQGPTDRPRRGRSAPARCWRCRTARCVSSLFFDGAAPHLKLLVRDAAGGLHVWRRGVLPARAAHIRPRLKPERRHGPPPAAAAAPQRAASKRLLFGGRRAAHRRRAPGRRWAAEFLRCWGVRAQNQAAVYLEGGSSEASTEPPSGAPARWASRSFSLRGS
jgi:hypothetical protein